MNQMIFSILIVSLALCLITCSSNMEEQKLQEFINQHVATIKPLMIEANLAYWDAATSGNTEDYDRYSALQLKIRQIYSNTQEFNVLKSYKDSNKINDHKLARQLDILYNTYLENQIDPELLKRIVDLGTEAEKKFSTFRGTIDGKKVTSNEIDDILKSDLNSSRRKDAWLASKQVGSEVADDLIQLVKLRNQAAQDLGYANYHTLSLIIKEQKVEDVDKIFNELYMLTNEPYNALKSELDVILANNYKIKLTDIKPWHYHDPFFQETPLVYDLDLDLYYQGKDVKEVAANFYAGIGLPTESILKNSDLYEREGKNPHAFCTDIDREGDVRILCNLKNNERWMETTLHELGHAVYDKFHGPEVPFLLRTPAHIFTTEAIAMFFGRLSRHPYWMQKMLDLNDQQRTEIETVSSKYAQLKQVIFARWAMVMYNFEKELYANPDQDLDRLWWQMVEKYQFVKKPEGRNEPDWAAKIHFAIAPCYYHNYLLGELFASQLQHFIVHNLLKLESGERVSYVNQSEVGQFLKQNIFEIGALYYWNDMISKATGEPLSPKYFVDQFVKG